MFCSARSLRLSDPSPIQSASASYSSILNHLNMVRTVLLWPQDYRLLKRNSASYYQSQCQKLLRSQRTMRSRYLEDAGRRTLALVEENQHCSINVRNGIPSICLRRPYSLIWSSNTL